MVKEIDFSLVVIPAVTHLSHWWRQERHPAKTAPCTRKSHFARRHACGSVAECRTCDQ